MAAVIYRCPVGAPGECPTSPTRGFCEIHMFQLERSEQPPAGDAPPAAPAAPRTPAGAPGSEAVTRTVRPAVRLALVIAGMLLPVRGEQQRGGGLAIGRDEPDCAGIPGLERLDQLSRHHARLRWIDGALCVEDLDSTNGTFVDDVPVTGPTRVWPGRRLRFAEDIDVEVVEIDEYGAPR